MEELEAIAKEALRVTVPRYADEGKFYYAPLMINDDTRTVYVRVTAVRVSGDEVIPLYTESEFLLLDQQDNVRGTRP